MTKILLPFLLLLISYGCSQLPTPAPAPCTFRPVGKDTPPPELFHDNFDRDSLQLVVQRSINYLLTQNQARQISVCGKQYQLGQQLDSLQLFSKIISSTPASKLSQKVYNNFDFCLAQNSDYQEQILVTGYYQPRLRGSLIRQAPFIYPIYAVPENLISALRYNTSPKPVSVTGRIKDGRFIEYWSRAEIENKNLLKGSEILYLADPIDAFTLHVQGSGLVELPNGKILQVHYANSNGRPYKSIGKLLADEGKIPLQEVTMPKIRQYLNEHLDDRQRILHYNERYIFFSVTEGEAEEPVGSMGEQLIAGRSVALDNTCFDQGGLFFLTPKAAADPASQDEWLPTSRFVLHQDTGSAIRGSGRLDLYLGSGESAGLIAGNLKHPALLYVLMKKTNY